MFGLIKAKKSCEQEAKAVYAVLLKQALSPVFYKDYGVPDTFEGRFDLLLLHVFMAMHVTLQDAGSGEFNQALFDVMFADMDQALREGGKGDMGVPKQMRLMMKAFNGRMNRYHEAFGDAKMFESALRLNLFGSAKVHAKTLKAFRQYVEHNVTALDAASVMKGRIKLKTMKGMK